MADSKSSFLDLKVPPHHGKAERVTTLNGQLKLRDEMVVLDSVFFPDELASARIALAELRGGKANREPTFPWPMPRTTKAKSYKFPGSAHFRSEIATMAHSKKLARRIAATTGAHTVRYWFDQLLHEEPASPSRKTCYHWHTERSRWKTCDSPLMVTAWIPLADVSLDMGPLTIVKKSSCAQWIDLPDGWEPSDKNLLAQPVSAGSILLFCWHTVHGNPPNRGLQPRQVLAVHFALNDLRYQKAARFEHLNERAVRTTNGVPDFSDERVCPVLYWHETCESLAERLPHTR